MQGKLKADFLCDHRTAESKNEGAERLSKLSCKGNLYCETVYRYHVSGELCRAVES